LAGCAGSGLAAAAGWPRFESVPGGVAVVNIPSEEKPVGYFNNMRVMTIGSRGQWQAIIGLPLTTQPGSHTLRVRVGPDQHEYDFNVAAKHYPESRITLADERMINPLPMDLERIDRETRLIQAAKATWSEVAAPPLAMSQPVAGEYSSPYGLRRFFNNQARNPHSGLDIAAPEGTPVMSAAPGRVVSTGDYFFNGNTVFIDHGQGLLTMYCHLQRIAVTPGQKIEAGMIIGNVGRTGRVTAAHLHWSVILNQTMVDPQLFLAGGTERP
jgi:murein DD-endopeptidase MepM/ murein hydrolase activator NlpD